MDRAKRLCSNETKRYERWPFNSYFNRNSLKYTTKHIAANVILLTVAVVVLFSVFCFIFSLFLSFGSSHRSKSVHRSHDIELICHSTRLMHDC